MTVLAVVATNSTHVLPFCSSGQNSTRVLAIHSSGHKQFVTATMLGSSCDSPRGEVQFQDRVLEQKHDYNEKCVSHSRHYNIIVPVYSNNSGHVYTLIQHPSIVYTIISLH